MAKRKSAKTPKWLKFIPVVLAVVVVVAMFLDGIVYSSKLGTGSNTSYSCWNIIFGYKATADAGVATANMQIFNFSILNMIAFVLPILGALLQLSKSKALKLVGAVCALGGTIMMFLMPSMLVYADGMKTVFSIFNTGLGVGCIIGGVVAGIETLVIGYEVIAK